VEWEPPIAYTGAATGSLVRAAFYCEVSLLHEARRQGPVKPSLARRVARAALGAARGARSGWARETIAGEAMGVPVVVSPDAILYEDGEPRALLAARVRRGLRGYPGDWAPLALAALALDNALGGGLDGRLTLVLVLAGDHASLSEALAHVKASGPKPAKGQGWHATTRVYDRSWAEHLLARPLAVIAGRAQPRPPPPGRCAKCRWRGSCPAAIRGPSGGQRDRRGGGGEA